MFSASWSVIPRVALVLVCQEMGGCAGAAGAGPGRRWWAWGRARSKDLHKCAGVAAPGCPAAFPCSHPLDAGHPCNRLPKHPRPASPAFLTMAVWREGSKRKSRQRPSSFRLPGRFRTAKMPAGSGRRQSGGGCWLSSGGGSWAVVNHGLAVVGAVWVAVVPAGRGESGSGGGGCRLGDDGCW